MPAVKATVVVGTGAATGPASTAALVGTCVDRANAAGLDDDAPVLALRRTA